MSFFPWSSLPKLVLSPAARTSINSATIYSIFAAELAWKFIQRASIRQDLHRAGVGEKPIPPGHEQGGDARLANCCSYSIIRRGLIEAEWMVAKITIWMNVGAIGLRGDRISTGLQRSSPGFYRIDCSGDESSLQECSITTEGPRNNSEQNCDTASVVCQGK